MRNERQETLELLVIGAMLASKTVRPDVRLFDVVPHRIVNELLARESKHNTAAWLKVPSDGALIDNVVSELSRRRLDRMREKVETISRFTGGASVVEFCREVLEYETLAAGGDSQPAQRSGALEPAQPAGEKPSNGRGVSGSGGAPAGANQGGSVARPPVQSSAKNDG